MALPMARPLTWFINIEPLTLHMGIFTLLTLTLVKK